MSLQFKFALVVLGLFAVRWASPGCAQAAPATREPVPEVLAPESTGTPLADDKAPSPASPGSISGTVVDQSGAVVAGAQVNLSSEDHLVNLQAVSGTDGQFFFPSVAPGPFHLTITSTGFAALTSPGVLHAGEVATPRIV